MRVARTIQPDTAIVLPAGRYSSFAAVAYAFDREVAARASLAQNAADVAMARNLRRSRALSARSAKS
jgi:hypothetical protein